MNENIYFHKTPFGWIKITADDTAVLSIDFVKNAGRNPEKTSPIIIEAVKQIDEYSAGSRKVFKIATRASGTEFQKKIWNAISKIPYGKTASYGEVAAAAGSPRAARAAGGACNKNPLPIIVPCHRVIGSDGSLVGFGGGLDQKMKFLEHEKKNI